MEPRPTRSQAGRCGVALPRRLRHVSLVRRARALTVLAGMLVVLCGIGGGSCGARGPQAPTDEGLPRPSLRLVIATDLEGTLEPCGCTSRPLGGIDKLASTLARLRHEAPTIFVHAGDLLFDGRVHGGVDGADANVQEIWKAETLTDVLSRLRLTASTAGRTDASMGLAELRALSTRARFPWLAEGLAAGGTAIGPHEAPLVTVGGVKIGVVGVSAMNGPDGALPEGISRLAPPLDAARAAVADVRRRGAQVVVALVRGDRRLARQVAETATGVDFVVQGGLDEADPMIPAVAGTAALLHAGRQGRHLVVVDLFRRGSGAYTDVSAWTRQVGQARLDTQMRELRARIAGWERDGVGGTDLDTQRARMARMQHDHDALGPRPSMEHNAFAARVVELSPDVRGDPEVAALMDAYDARVNEHNRVAFAGLAPKPAIADVPTYVGVARCAACHAPAVRWWRGHPHAHAYATLRDIHKEFNLSCVGCHVTGYGEPGGSNVTHNDGLTDVQCEQCHGPGSAHAASPLVPTLRRDVPEETCRHCHEPEHSDLFEYAAYRRTLIAPGHGLPAQPEAP